MDILEEEASGLDALAARDVGGRGSAGGAGDVAGEAVAEVVVEGVLSLLLEPVPILRVLALV
jgi:ABC-type xylose transport system permease subunit